MAWEASDQEGLVVGRCLPSWVSRPRGPLKVGAIPSSISNLVRMPTKILPMEDVAGFEEDDEDDLVLSHARRVKV